MIVIAAIITWTLITVTYGGDVGHSRGYVSKALCEQAKSVALTGLTIEQNKQADEDYDHRVKERRDAWRAAHPPRPPSTKEDFRAVEDAKRGVRLLGSSGPFSNYDPDTGMVLDYPGDGGNWSPSYDPSRGEAVVLRRGGFDMKHKTDVKHAECVLTDPVP